MPEISRFFGIVIAIFYDDHAPPHFHARYGDSKATFTIDDLRLLEGKLPPRAQGLVSEWASLHKTELQADWDRARRKEALTPIPPLE